MDIMDEIENNEFSIGIIDEGFSNLIDEEEEENFIIDDLYECIYNCETDYSPELDYFSDIPLGEEEDFDIGNPEGILEIVLEDSELVIEEFPELSSADSETEVGKVDEEMDEGVDEEVDEGMDEGVDESLPELPISKEEYNGVRIAFTADELGKIAKEARQRKFRITNETYLYPKNYEGDIKNFVNAIRFLENLSLNIEINYPNISRKIHKYLKEFTERYHEANEIISELNEDINYGKDIIIEEAKTFLKENYRDIINLLNECYPVGMAIKEYDPSSSVGIM